MISPKMKVKLLLNTSYTSSSKTHENERQRQWKISLRTSILFAISYNSSPSHRRDVETKRGIGVFLPRLYCWRRGCEENWTRVPLASKSRQRWNRWANNAGPVGSVHRRSRTRKRSIDPTPCHPRIPWVMSRTDPPTRSYPPLFHEVPVAFGTIRCRNPCATKLNVSTGPTRH